MQFEVSEMDKQTVVQRFKAIMNDHDKLTCSICNLTYMSTKGVISTQAFNHKRVGSSFAQDDSPLNIMRIAWIYATTV